MEKKKGTGLKFVPISDADLIPRRLVEQIEPREWDVDTFYQMGPVIMRNPCVIAGLFVDGEFTIQGFLLANYNPLDSWLFITALSVSPEHQRRGITHEVKGLLWKFVEKYKLRGIRFLTVMPEKFKSAGATESAFKVMEVRNGW